MDLGTALQQARERAGFSLPELAARTRIPQKTLRAIEENDFNRIPAGIFARSFIRTYAREVGVDPAEAVAQFRTMTEPVAEFPDEAPNETAAENKTPARRSIHSDDAGSQPSWSYALIVAALFVGVVIMNRSTGPGDQPDVSQTTDSVASAAIQPVGTNGTAIHIEMLAQRPCWVRAVVDGEVAFARLMQAGDKETVTGQRDVVMRIGDPSALSYSVNGRPGESLGAAEVPVTVRFGADGRSSRAS